MTIVIAYEFTVTTSARPLRYLLRWLIVGTRGGMTRALIIKRLTRNPQNAHQLAIALKVDYKTARYHLEILEKNHVVTSVGDKYGTAYFLTETMEDNYAVFEEILKNAKEEIKTQKEKDRKRKLLIG